MSTETETTTENSSITEEDILAMSDEDMENIDWDAYLSDETSENDSEEEAEELEENSEQETETSNTEDAEVETNTADSEEGTEAEPEVPDEEDSNNISEQEEPEEKSDAGKPNVEEGIEKNSTIDYEKSYKDVFQPLKANGKTIQVESPDDARQLMQMGLNYNKKMAALKPNLKVLKMLENNNLLSEDKINKLIDLEKKNPDAIKQLVKDSGLDPMDIDPEEETNYTPNTYNVDDQEVALSETLNEIKDTEGYSTTLDVVSNKFDDASRKILYENPDIILEINKQVENGIYAQVSEVVEKERMFGRLKGLNDLQAYKAVGDALHEAGKFNKTEEKPKGEKVVKPSMSESERRRKKKAAISTGSTSSSKPKTSFNPLNMSDEDFEKMDLNKYL